MSHVGWLDDWVFAERQGGAERTSAEMIAHGQKRGHTVDIITPRMTPRPLKDYDLFALNNVHTWSPISLTKVMQSGVPYIIWSRDFNFCHSRSADHDCRYRCKVDLWQTLFNHSRYNFFLSPKQFSVYQRFFTFIPGSFAPILPPVDEKAFPFGSDAREDRTVVVAGTRNKNHATALQRHQDAILVENVDQAELAAILRRYARIAMYPTVVEGCCRLAIEACLSGCQVVANDNVSFFSWGLHERADIVAKLAESPEIFWGKVESIGAG